MTTKKPEEATYFMAGNSSRIREKIQIHFEINFVAFCPNVVDIICFEQAVRQWCS